MNPKVLKRLYFTAYRFEERNSDATMMFIALYDNGFTPVWAEEAPSKAKPEIVYANIMGRTMRCEKIPKRALLINLPKVEAERFREWKNA